MKRYILGLLVLAMALLCACGPKESGGNSSGQLDVQDSDAAASSGQQTGAGQSSQEQPVSAACADDWLAEYQRERAGLGRPIKELTSDYDMLAYDWWPGGREVVRVDVNPLLFSGPPRQQGSVCAAIGTTVHWETSVDVLRSEWEDTLTFVPDDPVAGACWKVQAGEITFRFLTDSQGQSLRSGGSNLVLSRDELLPERIFPQWADGLISWIDQRVQQPGMVWEPLMSAAARLGQTGEPEGTTQSADPALMDLLYAGYGVKDPGTGIQYFAFEEGASWDAVTVPSGLVLGAGLPMDTEGIIAALETPFSWSMYNGAGYWFYLGDYKVFLTSDDSGVVDADSYFLIRWGDNAGI